MLKSLLSPEGRKMLNMAAYHELYASNLYKQLSNCMQTTGLFGAQKFFAKESADEITHYQKIADFMNDRFDEVIIPEIPEIEGEYYSHMEAFQAGLEAEMELEKFYVKSYKNCDDEIVKQFLLQFLEIQRKSVGEYGDFVTTLEFCGDEKGALLSFDKSLNG